MSTEPKYDSPEMKPETAMPRLWDEQVRRILVPAFLQRAHRSLWRHRVGVLGTILVVIPVGAVLIGPVILELDPARMDLSARLMPPMWSSGGSAQHPFGTDYLGRDLLARLLYGGRVSLGIGLLSVLISLVLGVSLGIVSGYFGGIIDAVIMRVVDIQLTIPYVAFAMAIVALIGPGIETIIIALGILGWVTFARVVRDETLSIKQRQYVMAAKSLGARPSRILARHILPNIMASVIVIATFTSATMITLEAILSYLGLGVQPPHSSWGRMISESQRYINTSPWQATLPGVAMTVTLLGVNLLGDWLRDVWDPQLRGRN
jgi:peptide/nickel transport system permease protein